MLSCPFHQFVVCKLLPPQVTPHAGSHVHVSGYAWSGGGRRVIRLEVTADHGKTWTSAKLNSLPQEYDR